MNHKGDKSCCIEYFSIPIYMMSGLFVSQFCISEDARICFARELVLVTNYVVDGEVQSYIKNNVSKAVKALNAATKDRFFALFRKLPEYAEIVIM